MVRLHLGVTAVLTSVLLAGCAVSPQQEPVAIHKPVDAFNATSQQPHEHTGTQYRGDLSNDVEHLQNAHRLYELSRDRQRARVKREQAECRQQQDSRQVPIKGAGGDFTYCQPAYDSQAEDTD